MWICVFLRAESNHHPGKKQYNKCRDHDQLLQPLFSPGGGPANLMNYIKLQTWNHNLDQSLRPQLQSRAVCYRERRAKQCTPNNFDFGALRVHLGAHGLERDVYPPSAPQCLVCITFHSLSVLWRLVSWARLATMQSGRIIDMIFFFSFYTYSLHSR